MNHQDTIQDTPRPILAAAVGIGDITLQRSIATGRRALRAGGDERCDLPYPSDAAVRAWRRGGAWAVRVPEGAGVEGAEPEDGIVTLYDWNGAITLTLGDAWLRLWPTRSEPFVDRGRAQRLLGALGRALPLAWLALAFTVGIGSFGFWASAALQGNPTILALGEDGGGAYIPERFASFGEGEMASAGAPVVVWVSEPEPEEVEDDALAEAEPAEEPAEPTPPAEPATAERADESSEAVAASDPAPASDARERGSAKRIGEHGAGSWGLGGGTDDGYADRQQSAKALERVLASCLDGDETHRVKLAVDVEGRADLHSADWRGAWSSAERECVAQAIAEWAFPGGDDLYEVSLKVRKSSHRKA